MGAAHSQGTPPVDSQAKAFSRADGLAMERQWWRELEDTHGIRPDDRSSWRQIRGDL